jgi:hypothetical protein
LLSGICSSGGPANTADRIAKLDTTILIGLDDSFTLQEQYSLLISDQTRLVLPGIPRSFQLPDGASPTITCSAESNGTLVDLEQETFRGRFYTWPDVTPSPHDSQLQYTLDCTAKGIVQHDHLEHSLAFPALNSGPRSGRSFPVDELNITVTFLFAPRTDEIGRPRVKALIEPSGEPPQELEFDSKANLYSLTLRNPLPSGTALTVLATWRTPPLS